MSANKLIEVYFPLELSSEEQKIRLEELLKLGGALIKGIFISGMDTPSYFCIVDESILNNVDQSQIYFQIINNPNDIYTIHVYELANLEQKKEIREKMEKYLKANLIAKGAKPMTAHNEPVCDNCGEAMIGDGYSTVLHCPYADADEYEADATPVHCINED